MAELIKSANKHQKRIVFHEITKEAIQEAVKNTRAIDDDLVQAQETRRVVDRLYGYEISPILWRKVQRGLSAGRVQSPAVRLIVERERERMAFVSASYFDIKAIFDTEVSGEPKFEAKLFTYNGQRIASGDSFNDKGELTAQVMLLDEEKANALADAVKNAKQNIEVISVESKPSSRKPAAPFTTSTLQQEASRKLRMSAKMTMDVAQSLYQEGYITYMRTDSPTLSTQAINAARAQAKEMFGEDHVAAAPRIYQGKNKNAQEAHEAIRPAGEVFRKPSEVAGELSGRAFELYDLIWKRTVASQMADAKVSTTTAKIAVAPLANGDRAEFSASGTVVTFRGFMAAYNVKDGSLAWKAYSMGPDADMKIDPDKTVTWTDGKMAPVGKDSSLKTWQGDQWKIGGGTTWGWTSYDAEANLIYYGSGNPSTWNPVQRPGDNKWSMTIWARDADTGAAKWVYQMTPHDEWDFDGINEMTLIDLPMKDKEGKDRYTTEIVVNEMQILGSKSASNSDAANRHASSTSAPTKQQGGGFDDFASDIPF